MEHLLADHEPAVVELYREFQATVERCGTFRIHPQKTRIAFITTMTFAGATLARRWLDVSFILPEAWDDERVRKIELFGPTSFGHTVRITKSGDFDAALADRMCDSWRRGNQETLNPHATVPTVIGHARSVLEIPLATTVGAHHADLSLRLPRYAVEALGDESHVVGRVPGNEPAAALVSEGSLVFETDLLRQLGLGVGDTTDVFIKPR